jgi:hypothetical protein
MVQKVSMGDYWTVYFFKILLFILTLYIKKGFKSAFRQNLYNSA